MLTLEAYARQTLEAGCTEDHLRNFVRAGIVLQPRQLAASSVARQCDHADGPTAIGYGGARGGGKSYWLLAQMGADDCQRVPGLKCLLLRKVGKANLEHFEDLRRRLFARLPHEFSAHRGVLTFPNGSRIIAGHFQCESDIDAYLGLEYDVIGIEEATTVHVVSDFDDTRAVEWWAALGYGFTHYTVVLLACIDGDGNVFVVDEHAERLWLPQRHAMAIKAMLGRHRLTGSPSIHHPLTTTHRAKRFGASSLAPMFSPGRATAPRSRSNTRAKESRCVQRAQTE